jgi:hypothetical protein
MACRGGSQHGYVTHVQIRLSGSGPQVGQSVRFGDGVRVRQDAAEGRVFIRQGSRSLVCVLTGGAGHKQDESGDEDVIGISYV